MAYSKYNASKTEVDGIIFDSKKEAKRYGDLKLAQRAGEISDLRLQPVYDIEVNGVKVCRYVADFSYMRDGERVVEDVKGMKKGSAWSMFRLKAKLVKAIYGVEVQVI